jgi:carboxyl-terminal processing protease
MKGEEGTDVRITIRRDGIDKAYTFKRTAIEIESVSYEMLDNYIGYIKISSFKKNTPEQFADALETLTSNSVKALIFDVRDNVGGLVTSLEKCVDPLLPEGVIANAVYKDNHEETLVYSDESEIEIPMVVLVNGNTASAAELFAASLKDFDKADIVGEQTFGKGVMQSVYKLDDGSAVSVTVAEYKTTVSDCYNGIGIAPDHIVPTSDEDKTDLQLSKAIEVINELD